MSDPAGEISVSYEAGSKTIIVWTIWLVMEEGQHFWKKVLKFPCRGRALRDCERGATVERSKTGERAMFAPAGQTTARAGSRSELAALVVHRQAPGPRV